MPSEVNGTNIRTVHMEILDVASEVVLPAMRAVFKDGEVSAFEVRYTEERGGSVEVTLKAKGEEFHYLAIQGDVPGGTAADWSENLRSLLVDFVAESRFGWGENRDAR